MIALGLDIGSTTVKAVVLEPSGPVLWKRYERHRTRQLQKVEEFLESIERHFADPILHLFTTGSGGRQVSKLLDARHVQEVNALSASVEHFHTGMGSVFELGGQDAKYISWRGKNGKFVTMNDRCAGGTGATIDRILMKLNLDADALRDIQYDPKLLYPVAGKCGVFAETDINSLQKQGIQVDALLISLFQAIVEQNLSVLARGYLPYPPVLLLGGPNVYFPALRDAWKHRLNSIWQERGISFGESDVSAPVDAELYGAYGAALSGLSASEESVTARCSELRERLRTHHRGNDRAKLLAVGGPPFFYSEGEQGDFAAQYRRRASHSDLDNHEELNVYIGIDGGSTSTKGVILDTRENVVETAYRLSGSNPVDDARHILKELHHKVERRGMQLLVRGIGFTGYAKDLLNAVFSGDTAIVETVAHTLGALKYFPNCDVICDVGGQDIKIILLKDGSIKDFRLNTQCSAGNGYYLQSTAERFGYRVEEYADKAFRAKSIPEFNFGCAVFLEADIVNFQQLGWHPEEIMAGLARILPQNVWLYVVQEPNLARLGSHFVLQGGTHNNLAVVKAQYDYIKSKVRDAQIHVHPYNEVAGAIGAALEARRSISSRVHTLVESGRESSHIPESRFIGFDTIDLVRYEVEKNERTRCRLCRNRCMRTVVNVSTEGAGPATRQYVIASCERGMDLNSGPEASARGLKREEHGVSEVPNFVQIANAGMFRSAAESVDRDKRTRNLNGIRSDAVIGMPRILGMYSTALFFRAYFESLGIGRVHYSRYTSADLLRKTAGRGSIDPCFPSKIAIAHVYDLMTREGTTHVFLPCLRMFGGEIHGAPYHWSCAALAATPEAVKAAFSLEGDDFHDHGIRYVNPVFDMAEWDVFERQLHSVMKPLFQVSRRENRAAMESARGIWDRFQINLQMQAAREIEKLEHSGGIGIVLLARPYHNDPGVNHGILDALNRHGYPIFTVDSLPRSGEIVERLFRDEIGTSHAMDVRDVWVKCYSENTSLKIWAAKFVARHPNLVALDLSSFRCGHDAPLYSVMDDIFNQTASPYFTFHEIDENKPESSIRLRVETIHYFLQRHREELQQREGPQWQKSLSAV
jgi:predicted CoA-substrate-specific enzyme activase